LKYPYNQLIFPLKMPGVKVPEKYDFEIDSGGDTIEDSFLTSSKITSFKEEETKTASNKNFAPITPKTDFAIRQANHLVERICRDNGVEAPKFSFSQCLIGQEDEIVNWSTSKHTSVLRLAEYLHKRGQIERDYSLSLQKLNRHIVQTGDTDERLGQLIVMGEKTAAGHMDWARKISEERIIEELKALYGENDEQRKHLLADLKKLRSIWTKAVGAFEKVRKNKDKAVKSADSAQLALDTAVSRGNTSKFTISKLQEDVYVKSERARTAREEYNRAMTALTSRQVEIFKEQIPQCLEGFEKMERSRIAVVRASMISLAQVHTAVADVEIESGERWLKSLIALSTDDEIEMFIRNVEEQSNGTKIIEEDYDFEGVEEQNQKEKEKQEIPTERPNSHLESRETLKQDSPERERAGLYSCFNNLTNSESDLLKVSVEIEGINDPLALKERKDKIEKLQVKLRQQLEALERMEQAYGQQSDSGNEATLEAVKASMRGIRNEILDNEAMIEQIVDKLSKIPGEKAVLLDRVDPMSSILEELNRLDQLRNNNANVRTRNIQQQQPRPTQTVQKKKALSRSFEDILREGDSSAVFPESASPNATGLKLPGTQWTVSSINKSNEEVNKLTTGDYFCADECKEEDLITDRMLLSGNRRKSGSGSGEIIGSLGQMKSLRRKSIGQSTLISSAISNGTPIQQQQRQQQKQSNLIPKNRQELFKVQALYNFIGRKETDELDLRTGEILGIYDSNGEWWEAENDAGIRGYIPFNYVIKI
jgi:hypothetical protein